MLCVKVKHGQVKVDEEYLRKLHVFFIPVFINKEKESDFMT